MLNELKVQSVTHETTLSASENAMRQEEINCEMQQYHETDIISAVSIPTSALENSPETLITNETTASATPLNQGNVNPVPVLAMPVSGNNFPDEDSVVGNQENTTQGQSLHGDKVGVIHIRIRSHAKRDIFSI